MLEQQFLFSPSRFCFVSISCLDSGFRRLLHREESTPLLHFKCMDSFSSFGNSEAPILEASQDLEPWAGTSWAEHGVLQRDPGLSQDADREKSPGWATGVGCGPQRGGGRGHRGQASRVIG